MRRLLHIVRAGRDPGAALADGDVIVYTDDPIDPRPDDTEPPCYRIGDERIDSDSLLDLIFDTDNVVTW